MASTLVDLVRRERVGRLVMLDPNIRVGLAPEDEYRERLREVISHSTIVKGSDTDLAWLYPDSSYEQAAEALLAAGVRLVAVALGAAGADGAHAGHPIHLEGGQVEGGGAER